MMVPFMQFKNAAFIRSRLSTNTAFGKLFQAIDKSIEQKRVLNKKVGQPILNPPPIKNVV